MKLNWLLFDLIDPDLPLNRVQRQLVKRRAKTLSKRFRTGLNSRDSLIVVLGLAVASLPVAILLSGWHVPSTFGQLLIFMAFWFCVSYIASALLNNWSRKRWINQSLRDFGYDVCLECGYWLRGLDDRATGESGAHCPECGAKRQPLPAVPVEEA